MKIKAWLASGVAGLVVALSGTAARAATPSYDFIELNYVNINHRDLPFNEQGGAFALSALIAPYLIFDASYELTDSDRLKSGTSRGRLQSQVITAGLAGRFSLVRKTLDLTGGLDFVYTDFKGTQGLKDKVDGQYDTGVQAKLGLRADFRYFEVIPGVRYIRISDEDQWVFGVQALACPGRGVCLTGGFEHFKQANDNRFTGGLRLYFD